MIKQLEPSISRLSNNDTQVEIKGQHLKYCWNASTKLKNDKESVMSKE